MTGRAKLQIEREVDCPSFHDHTPSPEGYLDWHNWARHKPRTHKQIRCTGCGRFRIWIPKRRTGGEGQPR